MRKWFLLVHVFMAVLFFTGLALADVTDTLSYPLPEVDYKPGSYKSREFFSGSDHLGEDISLPEETPVRAIGTGVLVKYGPAEGYGELVAVIEIDLGKYFTFVNAYGNNVSTRCILSISGHLRKKQHRDDAHELTWKEGQIVQRGDIIGYVSDDAHNGDGEEHLHQGTRLSDKETATKNDSKYFRGYEKSTDFGKDFASTKRVIETVQGKGTPVQLSCSTVQSQYTDIFQREGIADCQDVVFSPPNKYSVWHQVYDGMYGHWGTKVTTFEVPTVRGASISVNTIYLDDPGDEDSGVVEFKPDGPDGNVKYVEVSRDGVNWFPKLQVFAGEKIKVRVTVTNKGDETIDYFEVKVYRTRNETFNPNSDYKCGREEDEDDLKPGGSKRKHRDITAPTTPGTHRIYADINRVDGEYGGVDQDWNNNISRDYKSDPEESAVIEVIPTNYLPEGHIDLVSSDTVEGWVRDRNTTTPVKVHIYSSDTYGNNKAFVGEIVADQWRSDLGAYCGFRWVVPAQFKDGVGRKIYLYAINVPRNDAANPLITGGEFQLMCAPPAPTTKADWRFYHPVLQSWFHTINEAERDQTPQWGWLGEGISWYAFDQPQPETIPLYRSWNGDEHFYTTNWSEYQYVVNTLRWTGEWIVMYVYGWQSPGTVPVYRFLSPYTGKHFFTASEDEKGWFLSGGWYLEGIAFYVYPSPR